MSVYDYTVQGRRIEEHVLAGKRLGRHIHHDSRSLLYVAQQAPVRDVLHLSNGLPLDQGNVGSCTAEALCGSLNTQPNYVAGGAVLTQADAIKLYERETADEGHPYPAEDPGGTGVAVGKAAKELGWIKSYQTAQGLNGLLGALVVRPVIIGINWYDSFDNPESSGLCAITPNATVRGGHEVLCVGIDTENKHVHLWNSWGDSWGNHGQFIFAYDTITRLLGEGGDCTVPVV